MLLKKEEQMYGGNPDKTRERGIKVFVHFLKRLRGEESSEAQTNFEIFRRMSFEDFKYWLIKVNGLMRGLNAKARRIDGGDGVGVAVVNADSHHYVDFAKDKETLLREAFVAAQQLTNPRDAALLISSCLVGIHPFGDGNGRMSRIIYVLLHDNYTSFSQLEEDLSFVAQGSGQGYNSINVAPLQFIADDLGNYTWKDVVISEDRNVSIRFDESVKPVALCVNQLSLSDSDKTLLKGIFIHGDSMLRQLCLYEYLRRMGKFDPPYVSKKVTTNLTVGKEKTSIWVNPDSLLSDFTQGDLDQILAIADEMRTRYIRKEIEFFQHPENYPATRDSSISVKEYFSRRIPST